MKNYNLILLVLISIFIITISCKKKDEDENKFVEHEENGSFSTASELTLLETYDAKIDPKQDIDYFIANINSDVSITIDGDSNLELYFYIYNENEIQIHGGDTGARGASYTQTVSVNDYNGKIYIKIESAYPDDTGNYTIILN